MINTVDEYLNIVENEGLHYRLKEPAHDNIWMDLIENYPELHTYIVFNKTLSSDVLFHLAKNSNVDIRWKIACKRKLNEETFKLLAGDADSSIRERIALNPKTPLVVLKLLAYDDKLYKYNADENIEGLANESISDIAKRRLGI